MAKGGRAISEWNLEPYGGSTDIPADISPLVTSGGGGGSAGPSTPGVSASSSPANVGILGTQGATPNMSTPAVTPPATSFPQFPQYNPPQPNKAQNWFVGTLLGQSPVAMEANQRKAYDSRYEAEVASWKRQVGGELSERVNRNSIDSLTEGSYQARRLGLDDMADSFERRRDSIWARDNLSASEKVGLATSLYDKSMSAEQKTEGGIMLWESVSRIMSRVEGVTTDEKIDNMAKSPQVAFDVLRAAFRLQIPENVTAGDAEFIERNGMDAWIQEKIKWAQGQPDKGKQWMANAVIRAEEAAKGYYDIRHRNQARLDSLAGAYRDAGLSGPGLWKDATYEFKPFTDSGSQIRPPTESVSDRTEKTGEAGYEQPVRDAGQTMSDYLLTPDQQDAFQDWLFNLTRGILRPGAARPQSYRGPPSG